MNEDEQLDRLRSISDAVEALQQAGVSPAVDRALDFCLYYAHLARQFLGDVDLGIDLGTVADPREDEA